MSRFARPALIAIFAITILTPAAWSGWSADPVQVHPTTNSCPQVAAAGDGAYGAIVIWQETTTGSTGPLYARHVLPDGSIDPAWASPAVVCATLLDRSGLGAVSDGLGGAYVWWTSGSSVILSRITSDGSIASGWPAAGRSLGAMVRPQMRPLVISDGAHGVYVQWLQSALSSDGTAMLPQIRAAHLGPSNTAAGGWVGGGIRALGTTDEQYEWVNSAAIGLAQDGGLWLGWATTIIDASLGAQPGDVRLTRYTSAGIPSPGYDGHGVSIAPFNGPLLDSSTYWSMSPAMSLVGVAADGADGAFVIRGDPVDDGGYVHALGYLGHFQAGGVADPAWPAGGLYVNGAGIDVSTDYGAGASFRALPDGSGGVLAGKPWEASESGLGVDFRRYSVAAASLPGGAGAGAEGLEFVSNGTGGMFAASYHASGPTSFWSPNAFVSVNQAPSGDGYFEYHDTPVVTWYGDIALAASGDGGAFFFWSQSRERFGIYAIRLNGAGQVTAVTPVAEPVSRRLSLRFARGSGIEAHASFASAGPARWQLLDVAGRVLAQSDFAASAGANAWTMSGTASLPSGLYFGRVTRGAEASTAKVAITR
jgi:hypothetical protein